MKQPLIVSYGGGVNSTALLLGMLERAARPDAILFADTGGEKPETYEYVVRFGAVLLARGFPCIQVVQNDGMHGTLEQECLTNHTLPSLAFGHRKCSEKYKHRPQHKWAKQWQPAVDCWNDGGLVVKALGIGAHENRRASIVADRYYGYIYPLITWNWRQEECLAAIKRHNLPVPVKSACFFCPASKKSEVVDLRLKHPDLFHRAVAMEHNAAENCRDVKGLGRHWSFEEVGGRHLRSLPLFEHAGLDCMCVGEANYEEEVP